MEGHRTREYIRMIYVASGKWFWYGEHCLVPACKDVLDYNTRETAKFYTKDDQCISQQYLSANK